MMNFVMTYDDLKRSRDHSYSKGEADAYYYILNGCKWHWKTIDEVKKYCEAEIRRCEYVIEMTTKPEDEIWLQL